MGHIEKRRNRDGSVSWKCCLPAQPDGYRPTATYRSPRDTKSGKPPKAAWDLLEEMRQQAKGGSIAPRKLLLADLLERWLSDVEPRLAPRTLYGYESVVYTHLIPALGNLRVVDLRPVHLADLWASERESYSAATIRAHYRVLHIALAWALRMELVTRNVADAARPPQGKAAEMQTVSAAKLRGLCDLAVDTPLEWWVLLAVASGARRSEVEAVRVRDIDTKTRTLTIAGAIEHTPGEPRERKATKTGKARTVSLPSFAVERLKVWKNAALRQPDEHVCAPIPSPVFSVAWKELTGRAKLDGFRFHDIRHSVATILLESGLPVKIVQERLGHSSPTTTLTIYAHVTERMREMASEAVEGAFGVEGEVAGEGEVAALKP